MFKWSEYKDGDVLYEAFLPEHERESDHWLLRASSRGHVLAERCLSLTWRPKFGPDWGDVAALESMTDKLVSELSISAVPDGIGDYVPEAIGGWPAEPVIHAMLYALVEQYAQAEASLGLGDEQSATYLGLPVRASARGLYPFAVTPARNGRMRRLIALDEVLKRRQDVRPLKEALLSAVLDGNIPRLRTLLQAAGIDFESD